MLVLEHMKRIVDACYPETNEERLKLWHDIKPVKFGIRVTYNPVIAADFILAEYFIPEDASYLVVLRTECYTTTFDPAAPDFQMHDPPPLETIGARWRYFVSPTSTIYNLTALVPIHLLCDVDEMLIAKGGNRLQLIATLAAAPDAFQRFIRTTVYAYCISAAIAEKIGGGETNTTSEQ